MHDAQKSALKVVVILVVRLYGIRAGNLWLNLVRYGLGVLPRTLLYCTENVAGIHACIRGRGQGSLYPPENRRNIVFPCMLVQ